MKDQKEKFEKNQYSVNSRIKEMQELFLNFDTVLNAAKRGVMSSYDKSGATGNFKKLEDQLKTLQEQVAEIKEGSDQRIEIKTIEATLPEINYKNS